MSTNSEETEATFYAKVVSFDGLEQADRVEKHIQIEARYSTGNGCRVRRTTPVRGGTTAAGDSYVHTIKPKKVKGTVLPIGKENNQAVDRLFMEVFLSAAATRALVKERYTFTGAAPKVPDLPEGIVLPPIIFEIDVFTTPRRDKSQWVKIDVEFQDLYEALEKHGINIRDKRLKVHLEGLPIKFSEVIAGDQMTDEQKAIVGQIWENDFVHPANQEILFEKEEPDGTQQQQPDAQPTQQEPGSGEGGEENTTTETDGSADAGGE